MQISVIHPRELGLDDIRVWHSMQRSTPGLANPFLSPEFVIAVGRVRPTVRVAVLTDGPAVTGFFPFERRALGAGVPVAAELTDCQGLIHAPGAAWNARELLRACRLSVWKFDHLVAGQQPFTAHTSALLPSPTIDLSGGFGPYFERLRTGEPRFCAQVARRTRKLRREVGEIRFEADSSDGSVLRQLMNWKSAQYRRTGRPDRFSEPWVVELLDSLSSLPSLPEPPDLPGGAGRGFGCLLSVLHAGDTVVAVNFNLRFDGVLAGWFMAYDPARSAHSPGVLQLMRLAEAGPGLGLRLIDMGKGGKWYKDKLKTGEIMVGEGIVTGHSPAAAVHWARMTSSQWAVRTIRRYPSLFRAADWVLKHYGRARSPRLAASGTLGQAGEAQG